MLKAYIEKIAVYLPENVEENEINRLTKKTGIYKRHIARQNEVASDLAIKAANNLFEKGINKNQIDFILLCTQSPDYILPTTACILQDKLGLKKDIGALDFNMGCSGYIYGLSLAKGLIESGQSKKVLLLTAETYSKYIHQEDYAVKPLFGDAATATLISGSELKDDGIQGFIFGTDGSGFENLIVPVGGMKKPYNTTTLEEYTDSHGNIRSNCNLYMNGSAISDFALEVVPKAVNEILAKCNMNKVDIDYYVFHQANKFMLSFLQEKCELMEYSFWNDVKEYGNTVSNSIPLALYDLIRNNEVNKLEKIMLVGFGVGLSWAGCIVNLKKIVFD